ncbi:hypothetical protein LOTGIDRAFT_231475 [Lottia gigantea]|uniref:Peptidase metallopeptidase domain-containing protein n=1 Tax=Lottia gigantea TaxID=225164 RepID=V4AU04_LOTGI|nr:hypothetical protein LOTGIDRAFT_231475 [Lottia gigantea]ESO97256.1 hypothetical protein LOTGIDRAFT_231475 [Lottia gigantea]
MLQPLFILVCVTLVTVNCGIIKHLNPENEENSVQLFDSVDFLTKFGYLAPKVADDEYKQHSEYEIKQSIRDFQKFTGLEQTGYLDAATVTKMKAPRCGFPDIIRNTSEHFDPTSPQAFTTLGTVWKKKVVTWKPASYTRQLSEEEQILAIQKALEYWSEVTPLEFEYTDDTPDIEIKFAHGEHGDGYGNRFDGRGGTLAHAFRPGDYPINGDTHFDEGEQWTLHGKEGSNLVIVAAHEFGHSLGLGHSEQFKALMAPYYRYVDELKLDNDDVRAIQSLYGPRPGTATKPPTLKPSTEPTTPAQTPDYCDMKLDAIDLGPGNYVYGYRNNMVYKMDDNGLISGYPKLTKSVFPEAPSRIRAVVYDPSRRQTYMFKGDKIWRYTVYRLDSGYPKTIDMSKFPEKPHAAIWYNDNYIKNAMFLFGHKYFWEWDPNTQIIKRQMSINRFWLGVPDGLEAAFQHNDGFIYFFKGMKYRKFNPNYRTVVDGYPKTYSPAWFKGLCGNKPH